MTALRKQSYSICYVISDINDFLHNNRIMELSEQTDFGNSTADIRCMYWIILTINQSKISQIHDIVLFENTISLFNHPLKWNISVCLKFLY